MARRLVIPICRLISAAQTQPFTDEEAKSVMPMLENILLNSIYIVPYVPFLADVKEIEVRRLVETTIVADMERHAVKCPLLHKFAAWLAMRARIQEQSPDQIVLVPPWRL